MQKLSALSAHIAALPGIARDNMESFADLGKLVPTGKDLGNGLEIGRFRYDAVIGIEQCPAALASLLLSSVMVWLAANDPDRDLLGLTDPEVDVTIYDEQHVFVQLNVEFDEALSLVPDPAGDILWDEQRWRVSDIGIDVAETLEKLDKKDGTV
ncbi:MAG: phage tail protein [Desulfotignum sp.]|nr:phage tail protein [Desulfotignum sp.]